jgi:hypothetical protein
MNEKMRYNHEEMEALESNFRFRGMAYGVYHSPPEVEKNMGRLTHCPGLREQELSPKVAGIPVFDIDNPIARYRYMRLSPLDIDMQNPEKRRLIISTIQKIIANSRMKITGVKVYGHLLHAVPMEPTTMNGPCALCSVDILIFFEPSFVDTLCNQLSHLWDP